MMADYTLHTVNVILRHHARSTYPAQTIRHVAEQIDAIYWASREHGEDDDLSVVRGLFQDVDLRRDE